MINKRKQTTKRRQSLVAAMVLGTALTALAPAVASADSGAIADISRYCTACWRNARIHPDSWTDCTQDVFLRLLERVTPDAWDRVLADEGDERKEFLRAIDAVKKRSQRSRKFGELHSEWIGQLEDRVSLDERAV